MLYGPGTDLTQNQQRGLTPRMVRRSAYCLQRSRKLAAPFAMTAGLFALWAAALAGSAAAAPSPCGVNGVLSTSAGTASCTYTTAGEDTFVVPSGVSSAGVVAIGAAGGGGLPGGTGGSGAKVTTTIATAAAATFYVEVGSKPTDLPGGVNGGGNGGFAPASGGGGAAHPT